MFIKIVPFIAIFVLCQSASSQIVAINGIDRDGYGELMKSVAAVTMEEHTGGCAQSLSQAPVVRGMDKE